MLKRIKSKKGFGLIFFTFLTLALLSLAALVIDTGHIFIVRNELQSVADMAALGAMSSYLNNRFETADELKDNVLASIDRMIDNSRMRNNQTFTIEPSDIQPGYYDTSVNPANFSEREYGASDVNAIRVRARMEESNAIQLLLGPILGIDTADTSVLATATTVSRNILLGIDFSGSTDNSNYDPESGGSNEEDQYTFRNKAWERKERPEPLSTIFDVAEVFVTESGGFLTPNDTVGIATFTGTIYYDDTAFITDPDSSDNENRVKRVLEEDGSPVYVPGISAKLQLVSAGGVSSFFTQTKDYFQWYIDHPGISAENTDGSGDNIVSLSELDKDFNGQVTAADFQLIYDVNPSKYAMYTGANFAFLDISPANGILSQNEIFNIQAPKYLVPYQNKTRAMTSSFWSSHFKFADNSPSQFYEASTAYPVNTRSDLAGVVAMARDYAFESTNPLNQIGTALPTLIIISDWRHNVNPYSSYQTLDLAYSYLEEQINVTRELNPYLRVYGLAVGDFSGGDVFSEHAQDCLALTKETQGDFWIINSNDPVQIASELKEAFQEISMQVPFVLVE